MPDPDHKAQGSRSCWDGSSGLLDARVQATGHILYLAFQKEQVREGKEMGRQQRSRKRLETSQAAGGPEHHHPPRAERKEPDTCGSGVSGLGRGWPKAESRGDTEQASQQALGSWACRAGTSGGAHGRAGRKEGSLCCTSCHPPLTYPSIHSSHLALGDLTDPPGKRNPQLFRSHRGGTRQRPACPPLGKAFLPHAGALCGSTREDAAGLAFTRWAMDRN